MQRFNVNNFDFKEQRFCQQVDFDEAEISINLLFL